MPHIDDTFVRRFTKTAIHARRFKFFYAVGAAWLGVLMLVPSVRTAVIPGVAGQRAGVVAASEQPAAAGSPAGGVFSGAPNATSGSDAVTDLLSPEEALGTVSETVADTDPDVPAADVPTGSAAPLIPPPPYIPIPAVPEPLKPALLAASPIVGGVCDTVGTVALIATVGSAAAPPEVPVKEVFPYITPVYIACGSIPLETKGECSIDSTLPNPVADQGLPVSANVGQVAFDQLRAIEVLLASVGAPNPGFSAMAGDPLGCVVPS